MRRKEREVSRREAVDILSRCDTVRIAMQGEGRPYVVPVSFGMEMQGDTPVLYVHCAREGMKLDLLRSNPQVCVEGDIFRGVEKTAHGITTRYESAIGFGVCREAQDEAEVMKGLSLLTARYGYADYPLDRCRGVNNLRMLVIPLEEITGKRNLPEA